VHSLLQDLRFAARRLVKDRWFTLAAIAALALGIGANSAVFTLVNAVLLRGLPFKDADRIMWVDWRDTRGRTFGNSLLDFDDLQRSSKTFKGISLVFNGSLNISADDRDPEQYPGAYISANGFNLIGETAALGRAFGADDDRPGAPPVLLIGNSVWKSRYAGDPSVIGKTVRVGPQRFEVVGAFDKRPTPGGFNVNVDDFVIIPNMTYQRTYGLRMARIGNMGTLSNIQISVVPREGVSPQTAMDEIQRIMRSRHGLKLDQPDDFDMFTQDSILKVYERVSQAVLFALVVISSIALMVGGIGVMAIMSITVTERTREIGVRKALGARRIEILFQFLMEAAFLTSLGGILGIALGSAIGLLVHLVSGFPVSLPWWSFAIGLGFSASVGIFFGMYPAFKASRLDPIEALRYE